MEKKDIIFLLALLGGAGYGVHANWDAIKLKLGLDDLGPGRIRAVELTKKARGFEQYRSNREVLKDRESAEEIQVVGDPWQPQRIDDTHYHVFCNYKEAGEPRRHKFDVDLATGVVTDLGEVEARGGPAPR